MRQDAEQRYVASLLSQRSFVMLQETHSTPGVMRTWRARPSSRMFTSHGTASVGGVAIEVSHDFLDKFDPIPEDSSLTSDHWEEVEKGRTAILHLRSLEGALDLVVCYWHTGTSRHPRDSSHASLACALAPADKVLTVLAGDFNYVSDIQDRIGSSSASWTGGGDTSEERVFAM